MLGTVQSNRFATSFGVSAPDSLLQMMGAPDEITEMSLKGTLYADAEEPGAYLDAQVSLNGKKLDAAMYLTEDFLGVGSKAVLGNSKIYGLKPQNLADQFENSVFCDPDSQYYLPIDTAELQQIDAVLEQLKDAMEEAGSMDLSGMQSDVEELMKDAKEFMSDFMGDLDYTVKECKVEYMGKKTDGLEISFEYTAEDHADTMEYIFDLIMDSNLYGMIMDYVMEIMSDYAEMSGTSMPEMDFDMDEIKSQVQVYLDEYCAELRESGFQITITYYIANADDMEKAVISSYEEMMVKEGYDAGLVLSVDFFGEDGDTVTLTVGWTGIEGLDGDLVMFTSTASSDKDYEHTMSVETPDSGAITMETVWKSSGDLHAAINVEAIATYYGGDDEPYSETELYTVSIDGDLDVSRKAFELKDGVLGVSGEDIPDGFEIGFEFGRKDGEGLPSVSTENVLKLSEKQIEKLITDITNNVMELSKDFEEFGSLADF